MRASLLATLCLALAAVHPALAAEARGTTQAVMIEGSVVLDGAMTDPQWAKAPMLPLGDCDSVRDAQYATWAKLLFSPTHLYVAFHCEEPDTAGMPAKAAQRDGDVWQDDCVEVFLHPDPELPYHQISTNSRGVLYDAVGKDKGWNGAVEVRTQVVEGKSWRAEMKIALADIGAYIGEDQPWRVNLNRTRYGRGKDATMECSWAVLAGQNYHASDQFGRVRGVAIPFRPDGVTRRRPTPVGPTAPLAPTVATCLYRFAAREARPPLSVTPEHPLVIPIYVANPEGVRIVLRAKAMTQAEYRLSLRLADGSTWDQVVAVGPSGDGRTIGVPALKHSVTDLVLTSPAPFTVHELIVDRWEGGARAAVRQRATADIWVSAETWEGTDERLLCWGDQEKFKLKTIQEMAVLRFDVSGFRGREVLAARLHLKSLDAETANRLRHIRFSTVGQDWTEGRGEQSGSCYAYADLETKRPWSWQGSDFSDVVMGNGGTLVDWRERRVEQDGWLSVEITPDMIHAMVVGNSDGLALQEGGNLWYHNHLFASAQAGDDAPYLEVELGEAREHIPEAPVVRVDPAPGDATLSSGCARVEIAAATGVFCWRASLDGKPLGRWRIPPPAKSGPTIFLLTDLEPGQQGNLELVAVSSSGGCSGKTMVKLQASAALAAPPVLAKPVEAQGTAGILASADGQVRCWAVPGLVKIDPMNGTQMNDDLANANRGAVNSVWDGRKVQLFGARAEVVSFQLVLEKTAAAAALTLSIAPGGLASPDGAAIPGSCIELFRAWYARNRAERWQPAYLVPQPAGTSFAIPDPLRTLEQQRYQSVYVDLFIPPGSRPGLYRGEVAVRTGGTGSVIVPLEVEVFDFELPATLSFIPQMNAYSLPENGLEYYKLAHQNRCVFFYRCPTPKLIGQGRDIRVAWDDYDRFVEPLLSGQLFKDNWRAGVPLEMMPLPFEDSWPTAMNEENYAYTGHWPKKGEKAERLNEHYLTAPPIEQALNRDYQEAFLAVERQFIEHFKEKGWGRTEMQCMFMGKITHRTDYGKNMWWTTDEPYFWNDWLALRFFKRLWTEGRVGASPSQWAARADISRPQWQADLLDGIVTCVYFSGGLYSDPAMHRRTVELSRRGGFQLRVYGGANPDTGSNSETLAWILDARLKGANAALPWQTLGGESALDDNDRSALGCNALFVPGQRLGHKVLADMRVKSFRDGAQLIEYLELVAAKRGLLNAQLEAMVNACVGLRTAKLEGASADNADAVRMGALPEWKISGLRRALAEMIKR